MKFIEENYIIIFLVLGFLAFALSIYLGFVLKKLKVKKEQDQLKSEIRQRDFDKRQKFLKESIITISRATVQNQCELSEACLRIKKLLENYPEIASEEQFSAIQEMYLEIEEFPFLEERAKLTKQEKFKQDNKRYAIEEKYNKRVRKALELLLRKFESI